MTKAEQSQFVKNILSDLKDAVLKKVPQMPGHWNGVELRKYIADFYTDNYVIDSALNGKRRRDYKNAYRML